MNSKKDYNISLKNPKMILIHLFPIYPFSTSVTGSREMVHWERLG